MDDPFEMCFTYPHGDLAAKVWGNKEGRPILALHGWQDNAGTFDTLLPFLVPPSPTFPSSLYVVALDFVGHGHSTHKARGMYYHVMDHVWEVRQVVQQLGWSSFTIIGHSMGSIVAFFYASLFPEEIVQLISLDLIKPLTSPLSSFRKEFKKGFLVHSDCERKLSESPPTYTEEEAVERLVQGSNQSLTENSARVLMKRGTRKIASGENLIFSRDLRTRCSFLPKLNFAMFKEMVRHYTSELLIIRAKDTYVYALSDDIAEMKKLYTENCSYFEYVEVPGTHHVHLNNPEIVAPIIMKFLMRVSRKSKL